MKKSLTLFLLLSLFSYTRAQYSPFLELLKDSLDLPNFSTVTFLHADAQNLHLVFNSNYQIGGYCDAGNGSVYYVKLNKTNGQILSTRIINSNIVMKAGAACFYNNFLYVGGEMASPFTDRSAFVLKYNTQTNSIVWQENFNMNFMNSPQNPNNPCVISDLQLAPDNSTLVFYGTSYCFPVWGTPGIGSFKGVIDTSGSNFMAANYGVSPYPAPVYKRDVKFTNAPGGNKAYILCRDTSTQQTSIYLNTNNTNIMAFDSGKHISINSTGHHFIAKTAGSVIYLVDKNNGSACFVTDTLGNILSTREYPGYHARALAGGSTNAMLTFVNDMGGDLGDEVLNVEVDASLNTLRAKRMDIDTFRISAFSAATVRDQNYTYNLFNKKKSFTNHVYVWKHNMDSTSCNEFTVNPIFFTPNLTNTLTALSFTGIAVTTSFTAGTALKGVKDSLFCFQISYQIPFASFLLSNTVCAGAATTFSDNSGNNPTSWLWALPGSSTPVSNAQNPAVTYTQTGVQNVTLTAMNNSGTTTATGTVMVLPQPTLNVTSSASVVCAGKTVTISAQAAQSVSWNPPGAGFSFTVSPSSNLTFTASTTGANGCTTTSVFTQSVNTCVSLENQFTDTLSIFPNPAGEVITIRHARSKQTGSFQLNNYLGQQVRIIKPEEEGETRLLTSDLPTGVYFLVFRIGEKQCSRKLVITR